MTTPTCKVATDHGIRPAVRAVGDESTYGGIRARYFFQCLKDRARADARVCHPFRKFGSGFLMKGVEPISIRRSFPELLQLRTETQAPPARRIFSQSASAAAREGAGART